MLHLLAAHFGADLPDVPGASDSVEMTVWKWVIMIGGGAIVAFWVIKRIAEVVTKRRTEAMVREVGEADDNESDHGAHS